jgi:hypothetical protein
MIYACCDQHRRGVLAVQSKYNGIDFIDVVDDPSMPLSKRQRTLRVHFLHPLAPHALDIRNVVITGGERVRNVAPVEVYEDGFTSPPGDPLVLVVTVNGPGDFARYTLSLVDPSDTSRPPTGFDHVLSSIDFTFKAACPSKLDCQPVSECPPALADGADFSYLAKDYDSFRTLMLDRLAVILPQWQETHVADLGMMLVEWLAFIGDYLSYQQDAVATEAFLRTARRRTSVRRHVRLVDYPMHDGRNARSFVHFAVRSDVEGLAVAPHTEVLTRGSQSGVVLRLGSDTYAQAINEGAHVFELMPQTPPLALYAEHNCIRFYTWGDRECCLPAGSTSAWLRGALPNLRIGDVLIFKEVKGPNTGQESDADPAHRCAVRLTGVRHDVDPIAGQFDDPPTSHQLDVTEIQWAADDALRFALCLSTSKFDDVSIALGNIALADHGRTVTGEVLPAVPAPNPALTIDQPASSDRCSHPPPVVPKPARFNPRLAQSPLTFADGFAGASSANAFLNARTLSNLATPVILDADPGGDVWNAAVDLLQADSGAMLFVAEVENDGSATLRFGDGQFGMAPPEGTIFTAQYRVGNGIAGNVGTESLCRIATAEGTILSDSSVIASVTNPLSATGGIDPQPLDQVRQSAPFAFRTQQRAVTETDYGTVATTLVDLTLVKAMGTFRWTGSWQTMFISIDPEGTDQVDQGRLDLIKTGMEQYRMAGHDVEASRPIFVSLALTMDVCVKPGYLASHVQQALLDVLSNRALPDGTLGLFHPDNFSFGQTIYLSPIYARVQDTPGVASVTITDFSRQGHGGTNTVAAGRIVMDRLEIARLDNDPSFPEHGLLTLNVQGAQ